MSVLRTAGRINIGIGWMLVGMGCLGAVGLVIVGILVDSLVFIFLFGPLVLFAGAPKSLEWHEVHRILLPPPGSPRRLAALAQLRDGRVVEIMALWDSKTNPVALLDELVDHRRAQKILIDGRRAYLARTAGN